MFFSSFMPRLFNMSMTASVAIVLVILLRLLLKKAPKIISYVLWGVVLFRLLCPVSVVSSLSLYNLFDTPAAESGTLTNTIEYIPNNTVHSLYPASDLPVPEANNEIIDVLPQGQDQDQNQNQNQDQNQDQGQDKDKDQLAAYPQETPMSFAACVWMAGVLVMIIYSIVSFLQLRRKLLVVVLLRDNIFIADDIKSPFVVGLLRPMIYLPCNLTEKEQEYIILHEQYHIKRLDHIMKALAFLALSIHWFNPLVWLAFILAGKDMEMSCDEAVIRKLGVDVRADYSASLLTLATGRRFIAGTPLSFGEGDTRGRIRNLANWRKHPFWVLLVIGVVCTALAVGLMTNPKQTEPESAKIKIVIPAGSNDQIVYSEEEISPREDHVFLSTEDITLHHTAVVLKPVEVHQEYAYDDPFRLSDTSIRMDAEKGVWYKIGIWMENPTDEDIVVYVDITNVEVRSSSTKSDVIKWFDYLETPEAMPSDDFLEIAFPEFLGCSFRWYPDRMEVVNAIETYPVYSGMPIWNTFFCDVTEDGMPDLCSTVSFGSDIVDRHVIIYDWTYGGIYYLMDRMNFDYVLRMDDSNGQLYVDKIDYLSNETVLSGKLVYTGDGFQISGDTASFECRGFTNAIVEIEDPTKKEGFNFDTTMEQFFENSEKVYYFNGAYSDEVIVHYKDGSTMTISDALTRGRATFTDLDRFGIQYTVAPNARIFDSDISNAIQNRYAVDLPYGIVHAESHVLLGDEVMGRTPSVGLSDNVERITVYLLVYQMKYSTYEGKLEEAGGSYVPAAVTFKITDSGEYILEEYWEPGNGSFYTKDIRDKFPDSLADDALNNQTYLEALEAETYNKALVELENTMGLCSLSAKFIDLILDTINSVDLSGDDLRDYLREHEMDYERLIGYHEYALQYCFSEFLLGGQTDLQGQIMASACQDVMLEWGEEYDIDPNYQTGQDWFDEFCRNAESLSDQFSQEELENRFPGAALFLRMKN